MAVYGGQGLRVHTTLCTLNMLVLVQGGAVQMQVLYEALAVVSVHIVVIRHNILIVGVQF